MTGPARRAGRGEPARAAALDDLRFPRHQAVRWFDPRTLLLTGQQVAHLVGVRRRTPTSARLQAAAADRAVPRPSSGADGRPGSTTSATSATASTPPTSIAYLLAQPTARRHVAPTGSDTVPTTARLGARDGRRRGLPVGVVDAPTRTGIDRARTSAALPHADDPPGDVRDPRQPRLVRRAHRLPARSSARAAGSAAGRPSSAAATSRCSSRTGGGCGGSTSSSTPTSTTPQIAYFRDVARSWSQDGDGIILCIGQAELGRGRQAASRRRYATLDYFITAVLGKKQDQVRLMLAGDKHHYVRYIERLGEQDTERDGERALITCGGGGAYLSATSLRQGRARPAASTLNADMSTHRPPSRFSWRAAYPTPRGVRGSRCASSTGCRGATRGSSR